MPVSVKVGGVWKTATNVYNKVGGVWKTASDMPVKVGGVWKTGVLIQGAYESIATVTLGSTGTVTFSSIPQTYQHLQVRALARSATAGTSYDGLSIRINGVATGSYTSHYIVADGAVVSASGLTSRNDILQGDCIPRNGKLANTFGAAIVDIHDYTSTTKNKVVRVIGGYDANGTGNVSLCSGMILNTSAVTSLTFLISGGTGYTAGSTFALYGIKGA